MGHIGFDIGTGSIKIAQCDTNGVRRLVVETLPKNLVKEGVIVSYETMSDFIRDTLHHHHFYGKDCAVVLPAGQVFLRRLRLPAMTKKQLKLNLPYEFRDYLIMGKDKYSYDYAVNELCRDESGQVVALDLTAAAVSKHTVEEYHNMFRQAGVKLRVAAPAECAYANLLRIRGLRSPEEAKRESCILDLGHATTRVHIFEGTQFKATRVIDCGGARVDRAIADVLGVDEHTARTYKETNQNGVQEMEDPQKIYSSIAMEIRKAVNFYGSSNRESDLQDVFCCGGGTKIAPLMKAIAGVLNLTMHDIEALLPATVKDVTHLAFAAPAVGITQQ